MKIRACLLSVNRKRQAAVSLIHFLIQYLPHCDLITFVFSRSIIYDFDNYIFLLLLIGKYCQFLFCLQLIFFHFSAIGNFVPFAMGSGGNRASDHSIGGKTPVSPNAPVNTNSQQSNQTRKKGRIDVKDVFNNDDDDDAANNAKKRKLVPLGKSS